MVSLERVKGEYVAGPGLRVSFVRSLADIVDPVVEHLTSGVDGGDPFTPERIIVPNAGVRAWLLHQIASNVGCGPMGGDGIAANIDIRYLGDLDIMLGRPRADDDPWSVGPLTFVVLSVISAQNSPYGAHVARLGGGLKAARTIADRFDRYNARRPSMVVEWSRGNAVLAPEVGAEIFGDEGTDRLLRTEPLAENDVWQFQLWREVRAMIGVDPWPAVVDSVDVSKSSNLPKRLLVAGVQGLSVRHLDALRQLSTSVDIDVLVVHPSPVLAERWAHDAGRVPVSLHVAPQADAGESNPQDIDPLAAMWLRGARDAQMLMASQGVTPTLHSRRNQEDSGTLLSAVRRTIEEGSVFKGSWSPHDRSIAVHRAHNLSRQVEILRDALIHAFDEIPGLEPHEVVVLCADIEAAAPLLESAFAHPMGKEDKAVTLPLVVADRALRDVDAGASLLSSLLRAVRGRFSVGDVLSVATAEPVMRAFGITADDVAAWMRVIERTNVRWGASPEHRGRMGMPIGEYRAHTWALALQRAVLGASLFDAAPALELGDTTPLLDVDAAELPALGVLARIISVLSDLEEYTATQYMRSVGEWCHAVESALEDLGPDDGTLDDALAAINTMRGHSRVAVSLGAGDALASFEHFASLLDEEVGGAPGRQPLRTGAVTATSLVPLRGVPYKVVCLVGFDEGTEVGGDVEGDDLVGRQQFVGDADPRLDFRRAILDAALSASDRLIVTCNGRSIKNNAELPLITPLAEFADLCVRCADIPVKDDIPAIVVQHPRHFTSRANYVMDGVVPGLVWSHDSVAAGVARGDLGDMKPLPAPVGASARDDVMVIDVVDFHRFVADPLRAFLAHGLGINTWVDKVEDELATIPLKVEKKEVVALCDDLLEWRSAGGTDDAWADMMTIAGAMPVGVYRNQVLNEVVRRVDHMEELLVRWGIDHRVTVDVPVEVSSQGIALVGTVSVHPAGENRCATVHFGEQSDSYKAAPRMGVNLLLLAAAGHVFDAGLALNKNKGKDGNPPCIARFVEWAEGLTVEGARERVAGLLDLYKRATAAPYPNFRGAGTILADREAAAKAFNAFVGNDNYVSSGECLIYGPMPSFASVYREKSHVCDFFADFAKLVPTSQAKDQGSVKPPDGSRAVQKAVCS